VTLCRLFEKLDPLNLYLLVSDRRNYLLNLFGKSGSVLGICKFESILDDKVTVLIHDQVYMDW